MGALRRFARCLAAAFTIVVITCGLVSPAAASDDAPALTAMPTAVRRGDWALISGSGLRPSTVYSLAATAGTLRAAGQQVTEVTTDASGAFSVRWYADSSIPASVTWSRVTATDPDNTTYAVGVAFLAPVLGSSSNVCPARTWRTFSMGFPDATYDITGDAIDGTATVTAAGGSFTFAPRLVDSLAERVALHVQSRSDPAAAYDFSFERSPAEANEYADIAEYPWHRLAWVSCLRPKDTVTFTSGSAQLAAPRPVTVDANGTATFAVVPRPVTRPSRVAGLTWRASATGQTGTTQPVSMWGSTLQRGQRIAAARTGLASPNGVYTLGFSACTLQLVQRIGSGYTYTSWIPVRSALRRDDCTAALTSAGDLQVADYRGRQMWSAGTGGSGSANRLSLRDDGNLVMYTSAGHAVWSSRTGIIRTASTLGAGQTLTRGQSLRRGTTRLTLRRSGNLAVVRGRATIWQSRTARRGVVRLQLTQTGRVVLRNARNRVVWANRGSETGISPHLDVQANGDVVVTGAPGELLWHTRTARHH